MAKKYEEPNLIIISIDKDVMMVSVTEGDGENFGSAPNGWGLGGDLG